MATVTITINGRKITTQAGITVLKAARQEGIDIPTLCDHPALPPYGGCRMCVVQIKGQRNLQTACTFPVNDGMEIETDSPAVKQARQLILELLFSERNHFCPYCEQSGSCELQEMGYRHGIDHWTFPTYLKAYPVDATSRYFVFDHNRCILCARCLRACDELVANHTLGLGRRGSKTLVCADTQVPYGESTCLSCGTCVQVCPTGALSFKRSSFMDRKNMVEMVKSVCTRCSVGCGTAVLFRDDNVVMVHGDWDAPANAGMLCKMGRFEPLYETRPRITEPLVRKQGKQVPVTWDEALDTLAGKLSGRQAAEVGVYVSSSATNEALYGVNKLFRETLKIANIKLHDAAGELPLMKPQAAIGDLKDSDIILVLATDVAAEQPVVSFFIKRALNKGARLIVVDDASNSLAPFASVSGGMDAVESALEAIKRANNPVVVYGVRAPRDVLMKFSSANGSVKFLGLEAGVNTRAARALAISGGAFATLPQVVYCLIGESLSGDQGTLAAIPDGVFCIVQASYTSPLTERADVVLPEAIWSERSGSLTNTEGRIQQLVPAVRPKGEVRSDWEILQMLAQKLGTDIVFPPEEFSAAVARL